MEPVTTQTVGVPVRIDKTFILYWVIVVLIIALLGKGLFASDEDKKKDALTAIDTQISELNSYKEKIANELVEKANNANMRILEECAKIPDSLKASIDCNKLIQPTELLKWDYDKVEATNTWTSTGGIAPVPERQTMKEPTLRQYLSVPECETRDLFFNTRHSLPKYNLEWLAYDIPPCIKWESMKVYVPLYSVYWKVEKVSEGTSLGNYVVLKDQASELRVVYWHTVVDKSLEWQILEQWDLIWYTNVSGESTWIHLHVELWVWHEIVSKHYFWSEDYIRTDQTRLLEHRQWKFKEEKYKSTYEKAISLLRKREGLQLKAYPDFWWCSIGYGSRARSCDEVIDIAEAEKRLWDVVSKLVSQVQNKFPFLNANWQAALTSFAYNCHKWWEDVYANWLQEHHNWCRKAWNIKLKWLVDRRNEEWEMIKWQR